MLSRLSSRWSYLGIGIAAIALTWVTDVLAIISLASRAFALFYALQCGVAATVALRRNEIAHRWLYVIGGTIMAAVALAVTVLGIPAE
jgi:hypothetical protein